MKASRALEAFEIAGLALYLDEVILRPAALARLLLFHFGALRAGTPDEAARTFGGFAADEEQQEWQEQHFPHKP